MPSRSLEISSAVQNVIYESTGLGDIFPENRHKSATVTSVIAFNQNSPGCFNTKNSVIINLGRTECILDPSDFKTVAIGDSEVVVPNLAKLWNADSSPVGIFENLMKVVMPAEYKDFKVLTFVNKIKNAIAVSNLR